MGVDINGNHMMLTLARDIGPKSSRISFVIAFRIDDEICYLHHWGTKVNGKPVWHVSRGMEGTTPAPHAEGTEIEYITATITPEQAAEYERYGRFVQRRNGSYPIHREDPIRQEWPEMNP